MLNPGQPLLRIFDPSQMIVDTIVGEPDGAILVPGARAKVRLDAVEIRPGEAALLFGGRRPTGIESAAMALDLSPTGDLAEAAARLFSDLRRLDATGAATIAVTPIPEIGLGEAINDRLRRAAAER